MQKKTPDPANKPRNKHAEAFKETANLGTLAGAVALSAITLNPLPLIAAGIAEVAYMLFVPDSKWYQKRLSKQYDREIEERRRKLREQILPTLSPAMQSRYNRLESSRDQIFKQSDEEEPAPWFREVLRKLDYLQEKFLLFGKKEVEFRNYLAQVLEQVRSHSRDVAEAPVVVKVKGKKPPRVNVFEALDPSVPDEIDLNPESNWVKRTVTEIQERYDEELAKIERTLKSSLETEMHSKAVLEKRQEVIKRRREHVGRLGSILVNLNYQSRLMEDTFGLINDEIRARSPEQVLADVDEVVLQTEAMTEALEQVAPLEQMVARLSA